MPNLFEDNSYVMADALDKKYRIGALTGVLDNTKYKVKTANAIQLVIPKLTTNGLAQYDRSVGAPMGDITFTYEYVRANYERSRSFFIDAVDNMDTANLAFAELATEFMELKVFPEIDAFRMSTYSGNATAGNTITGTLDTGSEVCDAVSDGKAIMLENEVPPEGLFLFITPTLYKLTEQMDSYKSKLALSGLSIVQIPQSRFYSSVDLRSAAASSDPGGYVKSDTAVNLNFMLIQKEAVIQHTKHLAVKVLTPEQQLPDGYTFAYRILSYVNVEDNKKDGIFVSRSA